MKHHSGVFWGGDVCGGLWGFRFFRRVYLQWLTFSCLIASCLDVKVGSLSIESLWWARFFGSIGKALWRELID